MFDFNRARSTNCVSAFLTTEGIDVVITDNNGTKHRGSVPYHRMLTYINGAPVKLEMLSDDELELTIGRNEPVVMNRQPAGHYFAPLRGPKREPAARITPEEARALIARGKGAAPAAPARAAAPATEEAPF